MYMYYSNCISLNILFISFNFVQLSLIQNLKKKLLVVLMHKCSTQLLRYKKALKNCMQLKLKRFNEYKNTGFKLLSTNIAKKPSNVCFQLNHNVIGFSSTYF